MEYSMSQAEEFHQNAAFCAGCADAAPSPIDREIWLRMQRGWLDLASKEGEQRESQKERRRAAR